MAPPKKLRFSCNRNRWRSPTAERLFEGRDGIQARSTGTEAGARIRVTAGHLGGADVIIVLEKKHLQWLCEKFAADLTGKPVVCLHIADDYEFLQPELVALLQINVSPHQAA